MSKSTGKTPTPETSENPSLLSSIFGLFSGNSKPNPTLGAPLNPPSIGYPYKYEGGPLPDYKDGGEIPRTVFHGDSRPPSIIDQPDSKNTYDPEIEAYTGPHGFRPRPKEQWELPVDLPSYAKFNQKGPNISFSESLGVAQSFAHMNGSEEDPGHVYVVNTDGMSAANVNEVMGKSSPYPYEKEITSNKGVPASQIPIVCKNDPSSKDGLGACKMTNEFFKAFMADKGDTKFDQYQDAALTLQLQRSKIERKKAEGDHS